ILPSCSLAREIILDWETPVKRCRRRLRGFIAPIALVSTQTRAVDDDDVFAGRVREILEGVAEIAAIEQEVAGFQHVLVAVERNLETPLGDVEVLLNALPVRRKRPRPRLRRQSIEHKIDAATEMHRRQGAAFE